MRPELAFSLGFNSSFCLEAGGSSSLVSELSLDVSVWEILALESAAISASSSGLSWV